jgi:hypothetical protein
MIVNHVAIVNEWNNNEILQNAETLILGSFNPFNENGDNADYYYGRCTNYFWRAIAEIDNLNPNIFFNNIDLKMEYMRNKKFCFLDIINSVEITADGNNSITLNSFINQKIHKEFSDQVLFTTNTKFENTRFIVNRTYNEGIRQLINHGRINKIIHTMGNNTIGIDFRTNWQEKRLGVNGFQGFINKIRNNEDITFVPISYSPSGRAVKTGGQTYFDELKLWLNENLLLS